MTTDRPKLPEGARLLTPVEMNKIHFASQEQSPVKSGEGATSVKK